MLSRKQTRYRAVPAWALLAFVVASLFGCDDFKVDELRNVSVDYDINDGLIMGGELVRKACVELTVNADSPSKEADVVIRDAESSFTLERTAVVGKPLRVMLDEEPFTLAGTHSLSISIPNRMDGKIIWRSPVEPVSVLDMDEIGCTLSVRLEGEEQTSYTPGQRIPLKTNSLGTFIVTLDPFPAQGVLNVRSELPGEVLTLIEMESKDRNSRKYHFVSGEAGEGTLSVYLDMDDIQIPYRYTVSISGEVGPGPGPTPSESELKAKLTGPGFGFVGDQYTASLSCEDAGSAQYDIKYYLDGSPFAVRTGGKTTSSETGVTLPSQMSVALPLESVSPGDHVFRVVICPSGKTTPAADVSLPFKAFSFDCSWSEYPSQNLIKDSNLYSKTTGRFQLCVDLGISSSVVMAAVDDGKTLSPVGGSSGSTRKCLLESPKRGEHNITLTFSDESGYSVFKSTKAACYDIYLCEYTVDGSNIYATLTGPGSSAPVKMDFTISGQLVGVVPYTEAVEYFGEHYVRNDYEYTYYDTFEKEFSWNGGESLGKKKIWSGWINTAAKYAQGKLSELKVTRKATRWSQNGSTYTKEYYTPTPYMQVTVVLKMKKGATEKPEYLKLNYEYSSLAQFVGEYGLKLYVNIQ